MHNRVAILSILFSPLVNASEAHTADRLIPILHFVHFQTLMSFFSKSFSSSWTKDHKIPRTMFTLKELLSQREKKNTYIFLRTHEEDTGSWNQSPLVPFPGTATEALFFLHQISQQPLLEIFAQRRISPQTSDKTSSWPSLAVTEPGQR